MGPPMGPLGPKNHTFKKSWPPWAFWSPLGILDFLKVQSLNVGVSIFDDCSSRSFGPTVRSRPSEPTARARPSRPSRPSEPTVQADQVLSFLSQNISKLSASSLQALCKPLQAPHFLCKHASVVLFHNRNPSSSVCKLSAQLTFL